MPEMSLDHILLSLLEEPMSGYDLKREFEAGAATFWPAQLSQIYPTLKRLKARGLLTASREASSKGPDRLIYARTEGGTMELERWLRSGPQVGRERFAYLGQLSAMGQLGDLAAAQDFLVQLRRSFAERRAYLDGIEGLILGGESPDSVDDASFFDWAALRMGMAALGARKTCCEELLAVLERRSAAAGARNQSQPKEDERDDSE